MTNPARPSAGVSALGADSALFVQHPSEGPSTRRAARARDLLQEIHAQLQDGAGRLSVPLLAEEFGVTHLDMVHLLSELRRQGLFERLEESPYFQITARGHAFRTR